MTPAQQFVSVAKRLADLPELSSRFARGEFSLDQVDAISKMATPETEVGLIEEALGLSNAVWTVELVDPCRRLFLMSVLLMIARPST